MQKPAEHLHDIDKDMEVDSMCSLGRKNWTYPSNEKEKCQQLEILNDSSLLFTKMYGSVWLRYVSSISSLGPTVIRKRMQIIPKKTSPVGKYEPKYTLSYFKVV